MSQPSHKQYLGDGTYIGIIDRMLVLTTENGLTVTNTIYIESEVWDAMILYVKRMKADGNL